MTKLATKISLSNFAPKSYLAIMYPADPNVQGPAAITLGTVLGTASGIKNAFGADGVTPVFGAKGDFALDFAPAPDGTTPESVGSGVLYLPEAFMDPILSKFEDTYKTGPDGVVLKDDKGKEIIDVPGARAVDIAYQVAIVKAGNAAKYSWQLTPLLNQANDPIAAVRMAIAKNREEQAQLEASKAQAVEASKAQAALEAPAKTKGK